MNPDQIAQTLRVFLASVPTLGLCTVDGDGRPYAANVNFVCDEGLNLYFISHPQAAHSRHILGRPAVAATAYAPFQTPSEIRGVQLRGVCRPLETADFDKIWKVYTRKFPYALEMERRARSEAFYQVRPTWFRMIDNSVHFGYKWETDWPKGDVVIW